METSGTLEEFRSSVEDLALEELQQLDARRTTLEAELADVKDGIRIVKSVLGSARPAPRKVKKTKAKDPTEFAMSEDREKEFLDWLADVGSETDIASKDIKERFPTWSGSYANMVAKKMREDGVLRLSARHGSSNIYRSMV